jgi:predicted flap endonuclease-1-like 5' DNA nuclease/uncharacterized coiled-coil DUF342 family protein
LQAERDSLTSQLDTLRGVNATVADERDRLDHELVLLRGSHNDLASERDDLARQLAELRGSFDDLSTENVGLDGELANLRNAQADLSTQHDRLQLELQGLGDTRASLLSERDALRAELEALRTQQAELAADRDRSRDLALRLDGALNTMRFRLGSLFGSDGSDGATSEVATNAQFVAGAEGATGDTALTLGDTDGDDIGQQLEAQLGSLRQIISGLTSERDELRAQLQAVQSRFDGLNSVQSELEVEQQATANDLVALRGAQADVLAERDSLAQQFETLRLTNADVVAERDGLRAELLALQAERDALQAEQTTAASQRDQLQIELTRSDNQLVTQTSAQDVLEQEVSTLRETQASLQAERDELRAELAALRQAQDAGTIDITGNAFAADASLGVIPPAALQPTPTDDAQTLGAAQADVLAERDSLAQQFETLRLTNADVVAERDRLRAELDALQARSAASAESQAPADDASALLDLQSGATDTSSNTSGELVATLQAQIDELREALGVEVAANDRLQTELATLRAARDGQSDASLTLVGDNGTEATGQLALTSTSMIADDAALVANDVEAQTADEGQAYVQAQLDLLRASLAQESAEKERLQGELAALHDQLAARDAQFLTHGDAEASGETRDQLTSIEGLDAAAQQRLYAAGIYRYADLAQLSPEQLREIVYVEGEPDGDVTYWIVQAGEQASSTTTSSTTLASGTTLAATAALEAKIDELREALELETTEKDQLQVELDALRAQLATRDVRSFAFSSQASSDTYDQFTSIEGLDAAAQQRLYAAGIYRYADLAQLSPEQLREIVFVEGEPDGEVTYWIVQAGDFVQAASTTTTQFVATTQSADANTSALDAELARLRAENERLRATYRDRLVAIDDLDDDAEQRLNAAGVYTYADLVQFSPERLREIVYLDGPSDVDTSLWIARARRFIPRQPDRLIDIDGIGPVFERRLHAAGIFTFAELVQQTPERLREIANVESWHNLDTESWIAQAYQFMANDKEGGA